MRHAQQYNCNQVNYKCLVQCREKSFFTSFFSDPGHMTSLGVELIGEQEAGAVETIQRTACITTTVDRLTLV